MTITPTPDISIITPHFNRNAALADLYAMLRRQTHPSWEWIVVDDASPEDPAATLKALPEPERIVALRLETNAGPSAARNRGLEAARGRFVAFLDSDDAWSPEKLQRQLEAALARPDPDRVFCWTQTRITGAPDGDRIRPDRAPRPGEALGDYVFLADGFAQTSSFFVARAAALKFDAGLRQYEDYLLFLEAGAAGLDCILVAEPLTVWRHDPRPDRLSQGGQKNRQNGARFLQAAGKRLSSRARLAFLAKNLGPIHVQQDPLGGCVLLASAVLRGAIAPRYAATIIAGNLLPPKLTAALRKL